MLISVILNSGVRVGRFGWWLELGIEGSELWLEGFRLGFRFHSVNGKSGCLRTTKSCVISRNLIKVRMQGIQSKVCSPSLFRASAGFWLRELKYQVVQFDI